MPSLTPPFTTVEHEPSADAVAAVAALDTEVWFDVGPHLSCTEAEALIGLFTALGIDNHAVALLDGHARGDAPGDDHWTASDE